MKGSAPLRGTQSLVGQMGWVFARPSLTAIEVAWRWLFGVPFLFVCWMQSQKILAALPPDSAGLTTLDPQNPWVAAVQLSNAWALYQPHIHELLRWLLPVAALVWMVVSALGRSLLLKQMTPSLRLRPFAMIVLQAAWLALFLFTFYCWLRSIAWAASATITPAAEPDLIGFSVWVIFLSLGFFTVWALASWVVSIAPLPFSDQLGSDALHVVWAAATIFFLVASDYFHVVRLKGCVEFWKMFRGREPAS